MTSLTDESPTFRTPGPNIALPPLTPATIKRATEGLAAARNQSARAAVEQSLANGEAPLEGRPERRMSGAERRRLLHAMLAPLVQVRIEHAENIPATPCMLAPNHLNHIDPFLMLAAMPPTPYFYVLGDARTLYNKGWKRQLIRRVGGVIPLDRIWKEEMAVIKGAQNGRADLADLAAALEHDVPDGGSLDALRRLDRIVQGIFARGDSVLIFPEGGLGTVEGQLRVPLKRGAVIYAMRAGVPIVPVGITGNRDLYLRKQITVRFGPALDFGQADRPKPRVVQGALDTLEASMRRLIDPQYQDPPGPKLLRHTLNHMLW